MIRQTVFPLISKWIFWLPCIELFRVYICLGIEFRFKACLFLFLFKNSGILPFCHIRISYCEAFLVYISFDNDWNNQKKLRIIVCLTKCWFLHQNGVEYTPRCFFISSTSFKFKIRYCWSIIYGTQQAFLNQNIYQPSLRIADLCV